MHEQSPNRAVSSAKPHANSRADSRRSLIEQSFPQLSAGPALVWDLWEHFIGPRQRMVLVVPVEICIRMESQAFSNPCFPVMAIVSSGVSRRQKSPLVSHAR